MKSPKSNRILKKREKKERKGFFQGGVWFLFLMKSPKSNGILEKRVKKEQEYNLREPRSRFTGVCGERDLRDLACLPAGRPL